MTTTAATEGATQNKTTLDQLEQKTPWHITFLHHPLTTKRIHSSTVQSEIGIVFLMSDDTVHTLLPEQFRGYISP